MVDNVRHLSAPDGQSNALRHSSAITQQLRALSKSGRLFARPLTQSVRSKFGCVIEQGNDLSIRWINRRQIRTFVTIAKLACQRQIFIDALTAVFDSNQVINLMWRFNVVLMQ
ncbi:MAG: hypothetical protein WKF84_10520 [Pyrinomonadaceae bacterium]